MLTTPSAQNKVYVQWYRVLICAPYQKFSDVTDALDVISYCCGQWIVAFFMSVLSNAYKQFEWRHEMWCCMLCALDTNLFWIDSQNMILIFCVFAIIFDPWSQKWTVNFIIIRVSINEVSHLNVSPESQCWLTFSVESERFELFLCILSLECTHNKRATLEIALECEGTCA